MVSLTPNDIQDLYGREGFALFRGKYNLNIFGIRRKPASSKTFDDVIGILWENNGWNMAYFEATTDPGRSGLLAPQNPRGTGILKAGRYPGLWTLGMHRGKYPALVQVGKADVFRDNTKDTVLDFVNEESGIYGINLHHAATTSEEVNNWSLLCQVVKDPADLSFILGLCNAQKTRGYGNTLTYCLFEEMLYG